MGLFKRSLPEDINITDPNDVGDNQPADEVTQPSPADWAINELYSASRTLMDNKDKLTVGDMQDLSEIIGHLQHIVDNIKKPF
jgi:hypothetical protein